MTAPLTPTAADLLRTATRRLAPASPTPRLDAEVLLRHALGLDRTRLFLRLHDPVAAEPRAHFDVLIARRAAGEPVAYLTGEREFMGLPFAARPGVLVPRPETEGLVEWALAWLADRPAATVVDVGTGAGAIALALAAHLSPAWPGRIAAVDLSPAALALAAENRARLGLTGRVALVRGDLLGWCGGRLDLILANLPYLRPEQVAANPDLAAEPALALLGGADGLDPIRRLLVDAPRVLAPAGAAALEIDPSQADPVAALLGESFPGATVSIRTDLAGLPRTAIADRAR